MITIGDSDDDQEKMMNDKVGLGWWFQIAAQVSPIGAQLSPNLPNCATKSSNMSQKHQIPGFYESSYLVKCRWLFTQWAALRCNIKRGNRSLMDPKSKIEQRPEFGNVRPNVVAALMDLGVDTSAF